MSLLLGLRFLLFLLVAFRPGPFLGYIFGLGLLLLFLDLLDLLLKEVRLLLPQIHAFLGHLDCCLGESHQLSHRFVEIDLVLLLEDQFRVIALLLVETALDLASLEVCDLDDVDGLLV